MCTDNSSRLFHLALLTSLALSAESRNDPDHLPTGSLPNSPVPIIAPAFTVLFAPQYPEEASEPGSDLPMDDIEPGSTSPKAEPTPSNAPPPPPAGVWSDKVEVGKAVVVSQPPGQYCAAVGGIHALRIDELGAEALIVDGNVRDLPEMAERSMPVSVASIQELLRVELGHKSCTLSNVSHSRQVSCLSSCIRYASGLGSQGRQTHLHTKPLTSTQVWSRGVSCVSASAECKIQALQVPISVCGIRVEPDDIMFIDAENGVVRIPKILVAEVLNWLENRRNNEDKIVAMVREGSTVEEAFRMHR